MQGYRTTRSVLASAALAVTVSLTGVPSAGALSQLEMTCGRQLGSTAARLAGVSTKAHVDCRLAIAAGENPGPCPTVEALEAIEAAKLKLETRADLYCQSVCSHSPELPCVADSLCPPVPSASTAERCTAGASNRPFDMGNIGFPGPYCETAIGHAVRSSSDIAECVESLTMSAGEALADATLGDGPPPSLSQAAFVCQRVIARRTRRLAITIQRATTACRNDILRGIHIANPADCPSIDPRIGIRTAEAEARLLAGIEESCTGPTLAQLDLCGAGPGAITSPEVAGECLIAAAHEIANASDPPVLRAFASASLVEAAYPPSPRCGDGDVNRIADSFAPLGEVCDGDDDDVCPGACIPPGDAFECTCGDRPSLRFIAESATTDIDQGWTGDGDDATVPDGSGFVLDLSDCQCTAMDGATCVGSTSDPICNVAGADTPRCSWDAPTAPRCDARGNGNFVDEDRDCWICDAMSGNAGAACEDEGDCTALCYNADDVATVPCPDGQDDCTAGEVCRGRCDGDARCVTRTLAPPTPVATGGSSICIVQKFREDSIGTVNVVTGEHAIDQRTRVSIYLGVTLGTPCPVCGGFCEEGPFDGEACLGSCSVSAGPCRFDSDCPATESCGTTSADCPDGSCNLSLICHGGPNDGALCRIEGETALHGAVSNDCPPPVGLNMTGNGLIADYLPATSEARVLPSALPCTAPGFELYDCPCPDDGGRKTQPNACAPACDAGAQLGTGCATGQGAAGRFTVCAGGFNLGRACDEDTDCPGSSCSVNPTQCIGDPELALAACATNDDCGIGTCEDACPSGRCVPLCLPSIDDSEEGVCSGGPSVYHCSGALDAFRSCGAEHANAGCTAICETSLTACDERSDCPPDEACVGSCARRHLCEAGGDGILGNVDDVIGAGDCVADVSTCPLEPLAAEGGDVFNSRGSPSEPRSVAVLCLGKTSGPGVNAVVGVGGPGRVRREGAYVTNGFSSLD